MNPQERKSNVKIHKNFIKKIDLFLAKEKEIYTKELNSFMEEYDSSMQYSSSNYLQSIRNEMNKMVDLMTEHFAEQLNYYKIDEEIELIITDIVNTFNTKKNDVKNDEIKISSEIKSPNGNSNISIFYTIPQDLKDISIYSEIRFIQPEQILPISLNHMITGLADKINFKMVIKENKVSKEWDKNFELEVEDCRVRTTQAIDLNNKKKIFNFTEERPIHDYDITENIELNEKAIIQNFFVFYYENFFNLPLKKIDFQNLDLGSLNDFNKMKTLLNDKKKLEKEFEDKISPSNFRALLELAALKNDNYEVLYENNYFMKALIQNEKIKNKKTLKQV